MSPSTRSRLLIVTFLFILLVTACNMPAGPTPEAQIPGAIHTQAAQTVIARLTQTTSEEPASTQAAPPSATQGEPQSTLLPTATPTSIVQPTATPRPATQAPTPTQVPCNRAEFVRDVTVPDGQEFLPGEEFTKVWRLKNVGSCTWTTGYSLVFVSGDAMDGRSVSLPHSVRPGETVDLEVELVAPDDDGEYRGLWMLHDGTSRFGLGAGGDKAFWVEIVVERPRVDDDGFNFAINYCTADWESDAGDLDCPGDQDDRDGFVVRLSNPSLENRRENEPALWTQPDRNDDGWISGEFPRIKIEEGDRFIADVGCLAGYEDCDVIFQLNYRESGPTVYALGEWHEVYDGKITRIDIDLTPLAGKSIAFILTVSANGDADEDAAFWLMPHIRRK